MATNIQSSEIRAELIRRELATRKLAHFLRYRFYQEKRALAWNWHLDYLCEVLEAAYRRQETRILINMPFRFLKTETVEQTWQAWMILQDDSSESSMLSAAAEYTLAVDASAKTLEIVSSNWFANLRGGIHAIDLAKRPSREDWTTIGGARRQAAGIGGQLTGKGADFLVWGDILKPTDANSDRKRTLACTWLGETFRSRLNNQKRGVIVGIMQRLHELDPTGYLLERSKIEGADKWLHVKIEMECSRKRVYAFGEFFKRREQGELLHPERIGPKEIAALKVDLGNNYEGQCNQNPIKMKGSYYQLDWFNFHDGPPPEMTRVYNVWDYALTEEAEEAGDYSVCLTFGLTTGGQLYVLDCYRARVNSVDLVDLTMRNAIESKALAIFGARGPIDKAIRPWLTKRMQETGVFFRLEGVSETTDIVERSTAFQSMARAGAVYLPKNARWLADFKLELSAFPRGAHDDMCAALAIIGLALPLIRAGEVVPRPVTLATVDRNDIDAASLRKAIGRGIVPAAERQKMGVAEYARTRVMSGRAIVDISAEDYRSSVRPMLLALIKSEATAGRANTAAMATAELSRYDRRYPPQVADQPA